MIWNCVVNKHFIHCTQVDQQGRHIIPPAPHLNIPSSIRFISASSQFKKGLCICFCIETRVSALLGDLIEPGPHPFQQPERPNRPSLLQTKRLLYITSHLGKVCRQQIFSSLAAYCQFSYLHMSHLKFAQFPAPENPNRASVGFHLSSIYLVAYVVHNNNLQDFRISYQVC